MGKDCSGWQDENADVAWALDCLRCCQLWSLRAYAVTLCISKSASLSQHQNRPFSEPPTRYQRKQDSKRWKLKKNNFPKIVQKQYVGEVGKTIIFVLHIFSIYSVPNVVEIGRHNVHTTVKWTADCFFDSRCMWRRSRVATSQRTITATVHGTSVSPELATHDWKQGNTRWQYPRFWVILS